MYGVQRWNEGGMIMTPKDRQLLLKDICARLRYGVKVCYKISDKDNPIIETLSGHMLDYFNENHIVEVKPYLRSMSSMTEEEEKEFLSLESGLGYDTKNKNTIYRTNKIDWLNKNMFDYQGLIPMGLAREALEGMYK